MPTFKETECPFHVGDMVRINSRGREQSLALPREILTVTATAHVPRHFTFLEDVYERPYWVWVNDAKGVPVVIDPRKCGGIWVGFLELDFLGVVKRAADGAT